MRFFSSSFFLFISSLGSAWAQQTPEVDTESCVVPTIKEISVPNLKVTNDEILINSGNAKIVKNQVASFSGGVTLIKKDSKIFADEVKVDRNSESFSANGNIHFQSRGVNVFANELEISGANAKTALSGASYQLAQHPGHGKADNLEITADGELLLLDSTFTTCPGDQPDWLFSAGKIRLSHQDNVGEAYKTQIRINDIPVFYLPYITFPINEKRKSGFIDPVFSYSQNSGAEISSSYYWNIAPNFDATITPFYMSKRGLQLKTEFRYLAWDQYGELNLEYLDKDNELVDNDEPRYLGRLQHTGTFANQVRAHVDFSYLSDDYYLVDIGSDEFNRNDSYLSQGGELGYFSDNWHMRLKMQDFAVLGTHTNSYKTIPQIEFHQFQPLNLWSANFDFYAEYSHFDTPDKELPKAHRFHVETGLDIPYATPGWFINSEFKLMQTNYRQERLSENAILEENVSRTLPKVRIHTGLNLERSMSRVGSNLTQTLEPQMQYLYIPFKDQSNIALYDSTLLQDDYNGLFRERRFSGLDRIAEANQLSWGLTSRILNPNHEELFHLSLGRIFYLNDYRAKIDNSGQLNVDKSAVAAEIFFQLSNRWQLVSDIQYNPDNSQTDKGQISLDYYHDEKHQFQLNHRYSRDVSGSSIEQMSMLTTFAINEKWQFVGRYTRDLERKRSLDTYVGFQYESCCWMVRLGYKRHINTNLDIQGFVSENRDEFNDGIMLSFDLKGLGSSQQARGIQEMFNRGIFGYKRPYFLNN